MEYMRKNSWLKHAYELGLTNRMIVITIVLSFVTIFFEIVGIGIFLPIFHFIRLNGDIDALVADSSLWQYLIDGFAYFSIEPSLVVLLIFSFSFFLFRQVFTYLRLIYSAAITQSLIQGLRNKMFEKYMKSNTDYHDSTPVGILVNIILTEVNGAISGVMAPIGMVVYMIMLLGYITMLLILSWKMTIFAILVILLASQVPKVWIKKSAQTGRNLVNSNTRMSEFLISRLRSPRLVRLAGTEDAEKKKFSELTFSQRKYNVFSSILQAKTEVAMEPIFIGLSFAFLYVAFTKFQLQIEVIGLYLIISLRLMPVVKSIMMQFQNIQRLLGSIEILEARYRDMSRNLEGDPGVLNFNHTVESIYMEHVSYRYPTGGSDVLKDVSIEFKRNQMIAIVGPSGSGKSTLIDLLPGLRKPTKGTVRFDGKDYQEYSLKNIRNLISYVPQSPQIFDGSIEEHILYGKPGATRKEVQMAIQLSGLEGFVNNLPEKYETIIGEDAVRLSGGQRQRLDLARALVKKSDILILDEPTSSLDAESEENFKEVLYKIRKNTDMIIIIISHRLASIVNADKIVVLNQGRVEAMGLHSDLLIDCDWYTKAWKMQHPFV
jgi:ABC-type multidrug transport system fused ATPase/permease subunit